jgi:hypothetical protein
MPSLYLPYEFTTTLITTADVDPFGVDPDQTTMITTVDIDPFGIDPDQTTVITTGLP